MKLLIALLALTSLSTYAADTLFLFKKNLNPKNVLHYSVEMDANCSLKPISGKLIDPYWIMGESDGHKEGLTNKEKQIFTPVVSYVNTNKTELDFNVAAVDLIKSHIPNPEITVRTEKGNKCVAKAFMQVDGMEIELKEIFISGKITWTLDWKTDHLIITGKKADGSEFRKKIVP